MQALPAQACNGLRTGFLIALEMLKPRSDGGNIDLILCITDLLAGESNFFQRKIQSLLDDLLAGMFKMTVHQRLACQWVNRIKLQQFFRVACRLLESFLALREGNG